MALFDNQWLSNQAHELCRNVKGPVVLHQESTVGDEVVGGEDGREAQCCSASAEIELPSATTAPGREAVVETEHSTVVPTTQPSMRIRQSHGRHPLRDSRQRPLHILIVGAGPSGLAMAIGLLKMGNVTFQILEKNHDVGGTWLENRYPGAACDVASHAYQYTFESNTDWSHHFAPAEEIGAYFRKVATKNAIYPHVQFNSRVTMARWDRDSAKWVLKTSNTVSGKESEFKGDVFVNAGGILNDWKWPDVEGLAKFEGPRMHTAAWDSSIRLEGKRVGIIGSGATSVQVVPSLQPLVQTLDVFIRSPTYVLPSVGFGVESSEFNERYTEEQKRRFREDEEFYRAFRRRIEQQMNANFSSSIKGSKAQEEAREWAENQMRNFISSKELQEKLIPSWELGCRRLTPGRPYLTAVQQPNVNIIRAPIDRICDKGIRTADGVLHELDVLVCATGFNTSFSARYDIIGPDMKVLQEVWKDQTPEAYMGLAISGYPNYFTFLGPNCPIANGSLIPCIEASSKYICQVVEKIQQDQIRTVNVKAPMQRAFNEYIQSVHQDLVWTGSCTSWYKDRATGRVTAVWPGSSIHYMEAIEHPRWEDFEIEYLEGNPFKFLGDGTSQREFNGGDLAYYLD